VLQEYVVGPTDLLLEGIGRETDVTTAGQSELDLLLHQWMRGLAGV